MKWSLFITLSLLLSSPLQARELPFVRWWNSSDEQIQVYDERHPYRKKIGMDFDSLSEYPGKVAPPEGIGESRIGRALVLLSKPKKKILLVTPKNIMGDKIFLNEEFRQTMKKCTGDRAWLVVLPENSWTETDLNPYCTMSYDEGQIRIDLYWMRLSTTPFVDIVTNGLHCIPHQLYGWDRAFREYVLLSQKCTGAKALEKFTGKYDIFLAPNVTGVR